MEHAELDSTDPQSGTGTSDEASQEQEQDAGRFEKTLAAQFEKALDKEFVNAESEQSGVLGEGAGRSFNDTKDTGSLETVVRVSRGGGGGGGGGGGRW